MIVPKHPLRGMQEYMLSTATGYELSTCVYLPHNRKILFVTEPVNYEDRPSRAIMGLLEVDNCILSSMLTEWRPTSSVTSAAVCCRGIVVCSVSGLVLVNFKLGTYKLLAGSSNKKTTNRVIGVATDPDDSIWFTYLDPAPNSRSRIYCLEKETDRLILAHSDIRHKPVRIAISPDGRRCYTACSTSGSIYVYEISENRCLRREQRVTYVPVNEVSSMKIDREGYLYVACNSVMKCWDRYGQLVDIMQMSEEIRDFVFTETGIIVMYRSRWVKLEHDPAAVTARRRERNAYSRLEGRFSRL